MPKCTSFMQLDYINKLSVPSVFAVMLPFIQTSIVRIVLEVKDVAAFPGNHWVLS